MYGIVGPVDLAICTLHTEPSRQLHGHYWSKLDRRIRVSKFIFCSTCN